MPGEFSFCEFNKQKSIRYHHDFGDFDFLLIHANDGSKDIHYYCSIPISKHAKETIGFAAIKHLKMTASALRYNVTGNEPNFQDLINILEKAFAFIEKSGSTPKPTNTKIGARSKK